MIALIAALFTVILAKAGIQMAYDQNHWIAQKLYFVPSLRRNDEHFQNVPTIGETIGRI